MSRDISQTAWLRKTAVYPGLAIMLALPLAGHAQSTVDGLIAWWQMDAREGGVIPDQSGNGHHLLINGSPTFQGNLVVFNDDGTLEAADADDLDLLGDWTTSYWAREDSNIHSAGNPSNGWMCKVRNYHDAEGGWFLNASDDVRVRAAIYGSPNHSHDTERLTLGSWYRITTTFEAATGTIRIYLNDALRHETVGVPWTMLANPYPAVLGGYLDNDSVMSRVPYCKGAMADVRIYGRALSPVEVSELAQDCNENRQPDSEDITSGISADCNINGIPDGCEVTGAEIIDQLVPEGGPTGFFGYSVSISGDRALVGAHLFDVGSLSRAGKAYVFVRSPSGWSLEATLTASDANANDQFGISVSLDGDTVAIGSHLDDNPGGTDAGAVYVFVHTTAGTWMEQAKLVASDAQNIDRLGGAVSVHGDTAIVSANNDDSAAGSAYVFVRNENGQWTQQAKLTADDRAAGDSFGQSVSIHGDTAVIGALLDDDDGDASGSAYVFVRMGDSWTQQDKLTADDAAASDNFGHSVSIHGDTVVVGSYRDGGGSAYAFVRTGVAWTQQAKLTALDAADGDEFGTAVAVNGDKAIIGSPLNNDLSIPSGSAYIFVRSGSLWAEQAKLTVAGLSSNSDFGFSVSFDGHGVVVGAPATGSAYVFTFACSRTAVFEPPVTNAEFVLQEGTTLPLKFHIVDDAGSPVHEEVAVTLEIHGPDANGMESVILFDLPSGSLRFDNTNDPPHYVANFNTRNHSVLDGGEYSAIVYHEGTPIGSVLFSIDAAHGSGRGNGSPSNKLQADEPDGDALAEPNSAPSGGLNRLPTTNLGCGAVGAAFLGYMLGLAGWRIVRRFPE